MQGIEIAHLLIDTAQFAGLAYLWRMGKRIKRAEERLVADEERLQRAEKRVDSRRIEVANWPQGSERESEPVVVQVRRGNVVG